MSTQKKVVICVLSDGERGGWIHPWLAANLITMARDTRFIVEVEFIVGKRPVDFARNSAIALARERNADYCFQIDNDQSWWIGYNPLDVLAAAGEKDVIGFVTMQGFDIEACDKGTDPFIPNVRVVWPEDDGEFFTCTHIGAGAILVSRRVWESVPGPWFVWKRTAQGELHETDGALTEGFYFCEYVRSKGFKVWAHTRLIPHFKTVEVTKLGSHIKGLEQALSQATGTKRKSVWGVQAK
jgi:hypothetical protein